VPFDFTEAGTSAATLLFAAVLELLLDDVDGALLLVVLLFLLLPQPATAAAVHASTATPVVSRASFQLMESSSVVWRGEHNPPRGHLARNPR
jgi:hypothetical protein